MMIYSQPSNSIEFKSLNCNCKIGHNVRRRLYRTSVGKFYVREKSIPTDKKEKME